MLCSRICSCTPCPSTNGVGLHQSTQSLVGTGPQIYPSRDTKVRWWQDNSDLDKEWTEQEGYNTKKKKSKNGHFVLHDGIVHSCLAPMPNLLRDLQPVSPSDFTCLCCTCPVLARGKHRAVAAEAAARTEGNSPPLNRSDPAGHILVGIPGTGTAPTALCMKHCPRLWQEVVLNDRLS